MKDVFIKASLIIVFTFVFYGIRAYIETVLMR